MAEPVVLSHSESSNDRTVFGFWIYLMTDLLMFAVLIAVYSVLGNNTAGGPQARELFDLPQVFAATVLLLTSSYTCGLGTLAARGRRMQAFVGWLGATFVLGTLFLAMEIAEFRTLLQESHAPQSSAALSAFYTLIGAHGLHVAVGLVWIMAVLGHLPRRGLSESMVRKMTLFSMYWHVLDIVWVCIFSIVYLRAFV